MKQQRNIIEGAMKYPHLVLAFVGIMILVGIYSLINMPRREFPEFTIRQGLVIGVIPGATSQQVEEKLTKKVEEYIFGYKEVDKNDTYSVSSDGMMVIYVDLNDNVKNSDEFWSKFRHGLDELKMSLPADVLALIGSNDFGDTSAMLLTMSSDKKSYRELEEIMKNLETEIRRLNSVSKIKRYGSQKEKIYVYLQPEKINKLKINSSVIIAALKLQESINFAGNIDSRDLTIPIHLPPRFASEEDIAEQIIYSDPNGNTIRLKDIARIERRYEDPIQLIRNNRNNSLLLSLEMQKGNNIVQFGEDVNKIIEKFKSSLDEDVHINVISSLPEVVDHSIGHFLKEFAIAIIAVIVVTMLLLPFRVASVAGITIPISVLITIGIMQMVGIQLHIVSLAGLIVVLGMVVDNSIVVIDNHLEKLEEGENPWNAAWKATKELVLPIVSATAAIIAAFMPIMLFLTGIGGDFAGTFPLTIAIALLISMIVSIFLVPLMCYVFIKKGLHSSKKKRKTNLFDILQDNYDRTLEWTFKNPKKTITSALIAILLGFVILALKEVRLFPALDRDQFAVEVNLPQGSSFKATESVIDSLEQLLLSDKRVTNVASFIGTGSPRFHDLYQPHFPSENYGQLIVNTISNEATIEILDEYSPKYWNAFPNATLKWKQIAIENFESPIEIHFSGNNTKKIKQAAENAIEIVKGHPSTTWVRSDWGEQRKGITIDIDRIKANKLGYSKPIVAATLATSTEGLPISTIWEGDYPLDVILTKDETEISSTQDILDQYITSPITFEPIPLRAIAKVKSQITEGQIVRRNGVRCITVKAELKRGGLASKVKNDIEDKIAQLGNDDVTISYGGDYKSSVENLIPLFYALFTSIVIILFILLLQFKTFRRVGLIMSTILMSILGAAIGLLITGYPFSFTAFIGIIGLVGIVVRNGIILVDYAFHLVKNENMTYKEAGLAAGKRRMRPIFLTSMAAAMGVIPMIISKSPLWGPLGSVICFGMIVGMILTLMVLPVAYWKSTSREKTSID